VPEVRPAVQRPNGSSALPAHGPFVKRPVGT